MSVADKAIPFWTKLTDEQRAVCIDRAKFLIDRGYVTVPRDKDELDFAIIIYNLCRKQFE
jgi:hypothetical protein